MSKVEGSTAQLQRRIADLERRLEEQKVCDYRNYETFTVAVTLENDFELYQRWTKRGKELTALFPEVQVEGGYSDACIKLGDEMKEWMEGYAPSCRVANIILTTIYKTLLNGALSSVDWREVAEQFLPEEGE